MECASVAAVGAAAAAAAAASGDTNATQAVTDAGAYTNPYASMLTPEKIQALEGHKDSTIAKRLEEQDVRPSWGCAVSAVISVSSLSMHYDALVTLHLPLWCQEI